jgi:outer membrane protein insertion porin family
VKSLQLVRAGWLIVAAVALVCLGQAQSAQAETVRVAMLPVAVNSSLPETEHLSAGLADMIAARLEQSGQIVIIRLDSAVSSREEAIAAGKKVGAEYVLFGSYTQFGDGASLDIRCARVTGEEGNEPRRVFVQAGSASEIIPKLSVLAENVSQYLVSTAEAPEPEGAEDSLAADLPDAASIVDLELRIEALERVIFAPPPAAESVTVE